MAMVRSLGVRMWCVSGVGCRVILHPSVQTRQCSAGRRERVPIIAETWGCGGEVGVRHPGCSKTLVHQKVVPEGKVLPGETTTIHCVHGDKLLYPVARLNLEVEGVPFAIKAAVAKNLPVSMLFGTDVPELRKLLGLKPRSRRSKRQRALLAITRARAKREAQEEKERCQKEADSQVSSVLCSNPVLQSPDLKNEFILQTDASEFGVGTVLSQLDDSSTDHPVCFFSRKLLPKEQRYSTIEKECLAI